MKEDETQEIIDRINLAKKEVNGAEGHLPYVMDRLERGHYVASEVLKWLNDLRFVMAHLDEVVTHIESCVKDDSEGNGE